MGLLLQSQSSAAGSGSRFQVRSLALERRGRAGGGRTASDGVQAAAGAARLRRRGKIAEAAGERRRFLKEILIAPGGARYSCEQPAARVKPAQARKVGDPGVGFEA